MGSSLVMDPMLLVPGMSLAVSMVAMPGSCSACRVLMLSIWARA